jgi:5-methylcytosine-specific restriction endonuclease McrA
MKCEYGCKSEAKYLLKSVKKWCCSEHATQCPELRRKNTEGLKKSYSTCQRSYRGFSIESQRKSIESHKRKLQEKYSLMNFEDLPNAEKRRRLLFEQDFKCSICNISEWLNKPITFHLDHIDGFKSNEKRENLRLICPNCHSQTETYCMAHKFRGRVDELA